MIHTKIHQTNLIDAKQIYLHQQNAFPIMRREKKGERSRSWPTRWHWVMSWARGEAVLGNWLETVVFVFEKRYGSPLAMILMMTMILEAVFKQMVMMMEMAVVMEMRMATMVRCAQCTMHSAGALLGEKAGRMTDCQLCQLYLFIFLQGSVVFFFSFSTGASCTFYFFSQGPVVSVAHLIHQLHFQPYAMLSNVKKCKIMKCSWYLQWNGISYRYSNELQSNTNVM